MTLNITIPDAAYNDIRRKFGESSDTEISRLIGIAVTEVLSRRMEDRLPPNVTREEFLAVLDKAPDVEPDQDDRL